MGVIVEVHLAYFPWVISLGWVLRNRRSEHFLMLDIRCHISFPKGHTNLPVMYVSGSLSIHLLNFLVLQVYCLILEVDTSVNPASGLKFRMIDPLLTAESTVNLKWIHDLNGKDTYKYYKK